ncbi:MAG TPA: 4-hydroxy-tetrahydrodipicolinate reductase [Bacteroidia bacterium]|jgi:4-hydroxy-tetrahydrodipicolinate reductase|nr:4-hydroxy-tetrahydrodipicolinate reductase [Bacteroidia bacterium]
MKIALLGYGKMGKIIEKIAVSRGHEIVLKVDKENADPFPENELKKADVAIEFSTPQTVVANILHAFDAKVPVVVGTTAWNDKMEYVSNACTEKSGGIFTASNFSLGVNLFFKLNEQLAKMMNAHPEYNVQMEEIHHVHKLDSPSGTGITLADGIIANLDRVKEWKDHPSEIKTAVGANELPIVSKRVGEVPGTHSVIYTSAVDKITITHEAFSREGFALGAVVAAEFMKGKKGIFGMKDLLK